jgi:ribonuclease HI
MDQAPIKNVILVFTDGACRGNPGPGGYGTVIVTPEGQVTELGGASESTTNNQMELLATIVALKKISRDLRPVLLFTDSTYVIRGITQWIWGWRKRDWKTAEGNVIANRDLWEELSSLVKNRGVSGKIDWRYSRGHVGTPGNERCDVIAVAFSRNEFVPLYKGSLLKYDVAIWDLPENSELPEIRPKEEKKKAHSYLSYVGGQLNRDLDWKSCEARVKGRPGAKFKKAESSEDEEKILKEWGFSSKDLTKVSSRS